MGMRCVRSRLSITRRSIELPQRSCCPLATPIRTDLTASRWPSLKSTGWCEASRHAVAYFISQEHPYWYTEDRQPDLAIVSEGQEHQVLLDAERVVFSGGDFMFCMLRNALMTLHGMLHAGHRKRVHFVFPADAIWAVDVFTPGRSRPYPVPMQLPVRLMSKRPSDPERYE